MGYTQVAKHKTKDVFLYRQGQVNYVLNAEAADFAADLTDIERPIRSASPRGSRRTRTNPGMPAIGAIWMLLLTGAMLPPPTSTLFMKSEA